MAVEGAGAMGILYAVGGAITGGAIMYFFKKYTDQSDDQAKALPVVTKSIEILTDCIGKMSKSIEELYESRNRHNIDIAEINMLHRVLKCAEKVITPGDTGK
jgi:hypothetical protein